MKLIKLSLITALLASSSAFAINNVKVSGNAQYFYSTNNASTTEGGLFEANNTTGQASLHLGLSADLTRDVSAGLSMTALSSLGLERQLANSVWEGTNGTSESYVINTSWLGGTYGKTTGKVGRMLLDTPLVFSET